MKYEIIPHSSPTIDSTDIQILEKVLHSKMISEGETVAKFEQKIADFIGVKGGVATSSGTTALFLCLKSLGIDSKKEVILPTYVCRSVLDAVIWAGATPVLCDVGENWNMNSQTVRACLSSKTSAIIVVHIFGISAEVDEIVKLGVPVIEDCAQALGGELHGKKLGSFGEVSFFSFHATKLLSTCEGGLAVTNDRSLLQKIREFKYGNGKKYKIRYRIPLTDLQACLGLNQIRRYSQFLKQRREIAEIYFTKLKDLPIILPENIKKQSIFFRFPIRIKGDFETIRKKFERYKIYVRRGVDVLLHRKLGLDPKKFPGAEKCFSETLSLPIYPSLTQQQIERIIKACNEIFKK